MNSYTSWLVDKHDLIVDLTNVLIRWNVENIIDRNYSIVDFRELPVHVELSVKEKDENLETRRTFDFVWPQRNRKTNLTIATRK